MAIIPGDSPVMFWCKLGCVLARNWQLPPTQRLILCSGLWIFTSVWVERAANWGPSSCLPATLTRTRCASVVRRRSLPTLFNQLSVCVVFKTQAHNDRRKHIFYRVQVMYQLGEKLDINVIIYRINVNSFVSCLVNLLPTRRACFDPIRIFDFGSQHSSRLAIHAKSGRRVGK
jgi:hypothetical protein